MLRSSVFGRIVVQGAYCVQPCNMAASSRHRSGPPSICRLKLMRFEPVVQAEQIVNPMPPCVSVVMRATSRATSRHAPSHGTPSAASLPASHPARAPAYPHHAAARLQHRDAIGEHVFHALKTTDDTAELDSFLGEGDGSVEHGLRGSPECRPASATRPASSTRCAAASLSLAAVRRSRCRFVERHVHQRPRAIQ